MQNTDIQTDTKQKKIRYPKKLWILAIGLMINVTGTSFLWPLTTIYVTEILGGTVTLAGLILMIQAGVGMIGSLLGGSLYDRIGGRKSILVGTTLAACSVFGIALVDSWSLYVLFMCFVGFSSGMIFPSVYAMAGGVWPEGGQKAFNLMYVSQNIGVAVGSALGGIVAQYSFTLTFMINGFTYILFALLVWFGLTEAVALQPRGNILPKEQKSDRPFSFQMSKGLLSLLILCFGFMALWLTYVQWQTSISAFMKDRGIELSAYSLLWTINGALILLFQPLSIFVTSRIIPVIKHQLLLGVTFFIICFGLLTQIQIYPAFIVGMVILTIGEIFVWPAVPATAARLAPEGKKGFYQGIVNSFSTAGRMLGPLIGGALYDYYGIQTMFYVMIGFCFVALISFTFFDRGMKKETETKKNSKLS